MSDTTVTLHVPGQEPVTGSVEDFQQAARVLKAGAARRAAAEGANRDLEEVTGNPGQEAREAEVGGIAADRLRSLIERYERFEEEVKALRGDQKDLMAEARSAGFDTKALKKVIARRKLDPADADEQDALVDLYCRALGA